MKYLKTSPFVKWAKKNRLSDDALNEAIEEFQNGLYEADLGKGLYKKRLPLPGRGKRGSARSIIFFQHRRVLMFCLVYPKNEQDDLTANQRARLDFLAKTIKGMSGNDLENAIEQGVFVEIEQGEDDE